MKSFNRVLFLGLLVVGLLTPSYAMGQLFFFGHPLEGQTAPDFTLMTLSGESVNMTDYRAGRPALIFFWATWCPHCRAQLKELHAQTAALEQQGIKVLVVDLQEDAAHIRRYLKQNKMDLNVFLDAEASVADAYSIVGIPTFFLLDAQGTIVAVENILPDQVQTILREAKEDVMPVGQSDPETAGVNR